MANDAFRPIVKSPHSSSKSIWPSQDLIKCIMIYREFKNGAFTHKKSTVCSQSADTIEEKHFSINIYIHTCSQQFQDLYLI